MPDPEGDEEIPPDTLDKVADVVPIIPLPVKVWLLVPVGKGGTVVDGKYVPFELNNPEDTSIPIRLDVVVGGQK